MASLVVPQAGQMRLLWTVGGALTAINVLGIVNAGAVAFSQTLANTLGTAVKAALASSALNSKLNSTFALANVGIRDIRSANQPEFLDSGAPVAGTGPTVVLPPQTSLVVTLRTANAGKRFRGRTYLGGFDQNFNTTGGAAGPTAVTASAAFITAIKSALVSNSLDLGVISRPNPAANPPNPGQITTVTTIIVRDAVWDTQRRRAIPGV